MPTFRKLESLKRQIATRNAQSKDYGTFLAPLSELIDAEMEKGRYERAHEVCEVAIAQYKMRYQNFHDSKGLLEWLMHNPEQAIRSWRQGINCGYRDPSGGLDTMLLLWYAAVMVRDAALNREVRELTRANLNLPQSQNWPGALGRFMVELSTDEELFLKAKETDAKSSRSRAVRETCFYLGVRAIEYGKVQQALDHWTKCAECDPEPLTYDSYLLPFEMARWRATAKNSARRKPVNIAAPGRTVHRNRKRTT